MGVARCAASKNYFRLGVLIASRREQQLSSRAFVQIEPSCIVEISSRDSKSLTQNFSELLGVVPRR